MRRIACHIMFSWLFIIGSVNAQTKVEVITKTIEDQFVYQPGYVLEVNGRSADISVRVWDQREVKVTLKLVSKGLTRSVAEKELSYQQYVIDQVNEKHVIRNYLLLPQGLKSLSTIQETRIEVYAPSNIPLVVKNAFGTMRLGGLSGQVEIESEYGEVVLDKVSGKVKIKSNFGDMEIRSFNGNLRANLEHTASIINGFSGEANIKTNLGDMEWEDPGEMKKIRIDARKSDVKVSGVMIDAYHWELSTKYGEIVFPLAKKGERKVMFGDRRRPALEITSDFGKITIEE